MIDLELCLATFSEYIENILQVAVDRHGTPAQPGSGRTLEVLYPLGLVARPMEPDADPSTAAVLGAGCLKFEVGGQAWAMPTTDPRYVALVPPLGLGGMAIYAPGPVSTWLRLEGATGAAVAQLYLAQDATSAHSISIDQDTNTIQICHAKGQNFSLNEDGGVLMCSANGQNWVKVSDDGIVFSGKVKILGSCTVGDQATALGVALGIGGLEGTSVVLKASIQPPTPTP